MKPRFHDTFIIWHRHWHILISRNSCTVTPSCNPTWTSKLPRATKIRLFRATVESYAMEVKNGPWRRSWRKVSMDATPECCERPWYEHWQQHMNNQELYESLPRVTETIRARRLRLASHSARHNEDNEETVSKVLLWEPQHGHPNRGRPRTTYIDTIKAWYWSAQYQRDKKCNAQSGRVERVF